MTMRPVFFFCGVDRVTAEETLLGAGLELYSLSCSPLRNTEVLSSYSVTVSSRNRPVNNGT